MTHLTKAILFDLDHILIDTPRGIIASFSATLQSMGFDSIDPPTIKATLGLPIEKAFSHLLGIDITDEKIAVCIRRYHAFFKSIVIGEAKSLVFPGVNKGLARLKDNGFSLAVITRKFPTYAEQILKSGGLFDYFDLIINPDPSSKTKPHDEIRYYITKKLGALPEHTIMVSDATHDILMANEAGIKSVGLAHGIKDTVKLKLANPSWIANSFSQAVRLCL